MQAKFSYTESKRDKLIYLIRKNAEDENIKEEMIDLLYQLISWNGKDKRTAGEISKDTGITVAEIGCPSCGITMCGAVYENKCGICGEPLIR